MIPTLGIAEVSCGSYLFAPQAAVRGGASGAAMKSTVVFFLLASSVGALADVSPLRVVEKDADVKDCTFVV